MALLVPLALAVLTIAEQRMTLPPAGGPIPRPKLDGSRHVRLVAPRECRLRLGGEPLTPDENGDFDVTGRLPGVLTVSPPAKVELVITPRVYIARQEFSVQGREWTARIWVRNTLDNTVNAYLTLAGAGIRLETTATVPPGVTQPVNFRTIGPQGVTKVEFITLLEKEEEAMEGGYKYEVREVVSMARP